MRSTLKAIFTSKVNLVALAVIAGAVTRTFIVDTSGSTAANKDTRVSDSYTVYAETFPSREDDVQAWRELKMKSKKDKKGGSVEKIPRKSKDYIDEKKGKKKEGASIRDAKKDFHRGAIIPKNVVNSKKEDATIQEDPSEKTKSSKKSNNYEHESGTLTGRRRYIPPKPKKKDKETANSKKSEHESGTYSDAGTERYIPPEPKKDKETVKIKSKGGKKSNNPSKKKDKSEKAVDVLSKTSGSSKGSSGI